MDSNDIPPGFGPAAANMQQGRAPEVFKLDPSWGVLAGEESQEVAIQIQREDQVLEAVYPDPSAIPESPAEPLETQLPYDDTKTLIIPHRDRHPVAENVALPDSRGSAEQWLVKRPEWLTLVNILGNLEPKLPPYKSPNIQTRPKFSNGSLIPTVPPTQTETEPHTTAGGAAHVGQIQPFGDMIDQDLLVKLLANPSMLQDLPNMSGTSAPVLDHRLNKSVEQHTALGVSGQPWNPAMSNVSGRHGEQEVSQSTPANAEPRNPDTPGVAGGPLTATGLERPPGFGPPPTVHGLSNFPGAFDGRPLHTSNKAPTGPRLQMPQNWQGYRPPSRPTNMPPLASSSIAQYLPATQPAASGSGRPLSQQDDEYSKDLIRLYGNKSEGDRVGATEMGNSYPASALPVPAISFGRTERTDSGERWSGREDMDRSGLSIRQGEGAGSVESRSGEMRGKSRQVCRYFRTPTGCRSGNKCRFLHESNDSERSKRPKVVGKDSSSKRSR